MLFCLLFDIFEFVFVEVVSECFVGKCVEDVFGVDGFDELLDVVGFCGFDFVVGLVGVECLVDVGFVEFCEVFVVEVGVVWDFVVELFVLVVVVVLFVVEFGVGLELVVVGCKVVGEVVFVLVVFDEILSDVIVLFDGDVDLCVLVV